MGRWAGPKYPEGPPPNYDPENPHADPVALLEHREYEVRRKEVGVAKAQVYMHVKSSRRSEFCQVASVHLTVTSADFERKTAGMLYKGGGESHSELQAGASDYTFPASAK